MLRQRILTAVLLLPPVLGVILFAPTWLFDAVVAAVLFLLALEYAALCTSRRFSKAAFGIVVVALFALAVTPSQFSTITIKGMLSAALLAWIAVPAWLATRTVLPSGFKMLIGVPIISGAGVALHGLKAVETDGRWILLAFVLVWAADIGGYVAGRMMGRHKLAPTISPGKTWEGFVGGVLFTVLVGVLAGIWMVSDSAGVEWLAILLAVAVVSVIGDLCESLLKRQAGVKDSGTLLPGHGGVLDRLDSMLAVAPVFFVLGLQIGIFGELSVFGR